MTNKEAIDKLQAYFITQEPEVVARMCGNLLIDLNRWLNWDSLSENEKNALQQRTRLNMADMILFINTGFPANLILVHEPKSDKSSQEEQ